MIALKKVLVPTDFSETSEKAVHYGAELAASLGAEVELLHVAEPMPVMYSEVGYVPDWDRDLVPDAKRKLDALQIEVPPQLNVTRTVVCGHPFVETVRYAKEHETDLIVIGTHGRGAIAHMLLGSVAEKVVRKASCPVLVVREHEHDFVKP